MTVVKIAFMFLVLLSCSVLTEQIRSKLVKRQPKPGSCPAKPSPVGPCIEGCKKDLECPNTEKCCFTGCGHACMKPDRAALIAPGGKREFEASCPKPQGPGLCAELCDTERGCRTDELCCFNGCGHSCMKPVR